MEPLYQNLLAALAVVVYVKVVVGTCDYVVSKGWIVPSISRKIIHVAGGSWLMFWPLFTAGHWTWRLNVLVPAMYTIQLFIKGAIIQDPNDTDVKTMTRTGNPSELLQGPILFTIIMNLVGLFCFRQESAIFVMACLGFGDGIAPLVGKFFPHGKYPTYPFRSLKDTKTLSGSLGFFVSSLIGYYVLHAASIGGVSSTDFTTVASIAAATTIVEGVTGGLDNPFIAMTAYSLSQILL